MQDVTQDYLDIISNQNYWFESKLVITCTDGDKSYYENMIMSMSTNHKVFSEDYPTAGGAISGEIDVQMVQPTDDIPKAAKMIPYVRVTDGEDVSEWLPKGVYYIDTRQVTHNHDGLDILTLHGYDAMLKYEVDYPSDSQHSYPLLDQTVVSFLAGTVGVTVDPRTNQRMNKGYTLPLPVGYSSREVLQIIAGFYGGNFIFTDEGKLLLIRLSDLPEETNYLIRETGEIFNCGEDPDNPGEYVHILLG